jgi:hypothetical protein
MGYAHLHSSISKSLLARMEEFFVLVLSKRFVDVDLIQSFVVEDDESRILFAQFSYRSEMYFRCGEIRCSVAGDRSIIVIFVLTMDDIFLSSFSFDNSAFLCLTVFQSLLLSVVLPEFRSRSLMVIGVSCVRSYVNFLPGGPLPRFFPNPKKSLQVSIIYRTVCILLNVSCS